MRKAGSWWVESILSIRGLFLPTVSWNLAEGRCVAVDDCHAGRGTGAPAAWVFYLTMCLF